MASTMEHGIGGNLIFQAVVTHLQLQNKLPLLPFEGRAVFLLGQSWCFSNDPLFTGGVPGWEQCALWVQVTRLSPQLECQRTSRLPWLVDASVSLVFLSKCLAQGVYFVCLL